MSDEGRDILAGRAAGGRNSRATAPSACGYGYIHSAVDDHSRLAYSEILPDETGPTASAFWHRAQAFFGTATEANIIADPRSFVLPDGRLDFDLMLREFADFWCEHAGMLSRPTAYQKSASYLAIMAFLQHVVDERCHKCRHLAAAHVKSRQDR